MEEKNPCRDFYIKITANKSSKLRREERWVELSGTLAVGWHAGS